MSYKKEQQALLALWEESERDDPMPAVDCDISDEDAPSDHSDHDTHTEQSDDEDLPPQRIVTEYNYKLYFIGKDSVTKWLKHKDIIRSKTRSKNIVTKLPGVKGAAKNAQTYMDCWKLFFPDEIIELIVKCTNIQLDRMRPKYQRDRDCLPTDFEEIQAFVGVLYLAGVKKAQHLNTNELWLTDGTAPEFFSAVMSKSRFHILVQAIRFDDRATRQKRLREDNLASVRYIFDHFVEKCVQHYSLGEYVTIDEMLEAFRGRCRFRQYIANKPAKYGIKIYAAVDARTFYTHNLEIYAGKQPDGQFQLPNDAASVVKRLLRHCSGTGRNVTVDNYFTSVPLANDLYQNHRLTLVGTLRKNKREIPNLFLDTKIRKAKSSMFAYGKDPNQCMLTTYIPKRGKNVLMLSTFHDDDEIDIETGDEHKPSVITFYNLTKGAVDVVDRMKTEYSVTRVSNRWPLTLFCSMLNIGGINSRIIYTSNTGDNAPRRQLLSELAKQLAKPLLLKRAKIQTFSIPLRQKIRNVLGSEGPPAERIDELRIGTQRKPRCSFCPIRKNRFTNLQCDACSKPICKEHTKKTTLLCQDCVLQEDE